MMKNKLSCERLTGAGNNAVLIAISSSPEKLDDLFRNRSAILTVNDR